MQIGMIGLGRMGANMARRLMKSGHDCVAFDLNPDNVEALVKEGASRASSLADFAEKLKTPRVAWVMVPAGEPTEKTVMGLADHLEPGDIVIDGGNSYYKDDVRRARALKKEGIHYVDAGTSGGVWGVDRGYCLMVGGDREAMERVDPLLEALAPGMGNVERTPERARKGVAGTAERGYFHCGPAGAGHFVKMVHNGIEYGVMQAYAEGFDILRNANAPSLEDGFRYDFDTGEIAELWRRGSVIGSWLLDLTAMALAEDEGLAGYSGHVQDSGEGRWTVMAAVEEAVSADVLTAALYTRFRSRQSHTYAEKVLSAMRHKFGGHIERPTGG